MARTMEVENSSINIINNGTLIKGDITASGDFRLDGTLEGNIQLDGKLVVGDTGGNDTQKLEKADEWIGQLRKITEPQFLAMFNPS